jgi:Na+-translocating ferredoxin:NAD+ oxidoreductase RnfD subunit
VSPWVLAYALPALTLTAVGLALRRASRDPKTPRGDAVLLDLCLGLVAVAAAVFWLVAVLQAVF